MLALCTTLLTACTGSGSGDGRTPTRAEISALLTQHGKALRARDERAFVAGATGAFGDRQRAVFGNVAAVPLSAWTYTIGPQVQDAGAQRAARTKFGASAVIVRVSFRYALRGVDTRPTAHDLYWTFVRAGSSVAVADDAGAADVGGASWRGPWDYGPLRVAAGRSSLVLAHPAEADLLPGLVADVDRAVPVVTGVVGRGWRQRVAVLVPGSADERAAALGSAAGDTAEVGAVATSDGTDATSGDVLGQRVVVVADQFRRLTPLGVRLVMQHEITHIATARQTSSATPTWLVEGLADYVGHLGDTRPVGTAAPELAAQVRRDGAPTALPTSSAFTAAATAGAAYQLAWLACRRIAEQHGQAALVRFYDAAAQAAAATTEDEAVAQAARQVLGESPARLVDRTRSYVARVFA